MEMDGVTLRFQEGLADFVGGIALLVCSAFDLCFGMRTSLKQQQHGAIAVESLDSSSLPPGLYLAALRQRSIRIASTVFVRGMFGISPNDAKRVGHD